MMIDDQGIARGIERVFGVAPFEVTIIGCQRRVHVRVMCPDKQLVSTLRVRETEMKDDIKGLFKEVSWPSST